MLVAIVCVAYVVFFIVTWKSLMWLATPTWRKPPRAPRVIDDRFLIPKEEWL